MIENVYVWKQLNFHPDSFINFFFCFFLLFIDADIFILALNVIDEGYNNCVKRSYLLNMYIPSLKIHAILLGRHSQLHTLVESSTFMKWKFLKWLQSAKNLVTSYFCLLYLCFRLCIVMFTCWMMRWSGKSYLLCQNLIPILNLHGWLLTIPLFLLEARQISTQKRRRWCWTGKFSSLIWISWYEVLSFLYFDAKLHELKYVVVQTQTCTSTLIHVESLYQLSLIWMLLVLVSATSAQWLSNI